MNHQAPTSPPSLLEAFLVLVFLTGICFVSWSIYDKVTREKQQETVCFQFKVSSITRNQGQGGGPRS